ncbi:MAG: DMT family transporter [Bacillota bacterium]|nr:DMT family transporter [Bacillota bacterium]
MGSEGGERRGLGYAILATVFFATAGPLARMASALPPAQVAFWRVLLGAAAILALGLAQGKAPRVRPADLPLLFAYGAVLGLHFYFYIGSLFRTSLGHALILVNTAPIWAALLSAIVLRETLAAAKLPGLALGVLGTAWLVAGDPAAGRATLAGDGFGLLAAVCYAAYAVAGRRERARYELLTYAFWVYLGAALALAIAAPRTTILASVPAAAWPPLVLLALLPTCFGHTLFNASLRLIHAAKANLLATQEATGGMIIGWLLLGEIPTSTALLAWPLVMAGIVWVVLPQRSVPGEAKNTPGPPR